MIFLAQAAVDQHECFHSIALILDFLRVTHDLRNDFLHEAVFQRNITAPKFLREYLMPKARADFFAATIACNNLHRRISRPVVLEREKRKSQVLIRTLDRMAGEEVVSYENAGGFRVFRNSIHDAFRSALVDVVLPLEDLQPWWIDIEREFLRQICVISSKHVPKGMVRGADSYRCRSILNLVFLIDELTDVVGLGYVTIQFLICKYDILILLLEPDRDVSQP